eukprot:scaffold90757_cov32-Tisochrysis_lutea.AAC.6
MHLCRRLLLLALGFAAVEARLSCSAVRRACMITMCEPPLPTSPEGWMTVLSEQQFAILRKGHTEPPGFSENFEGQLEWYAPPLALEEARPTRHGIFLAITLNHANASLSRPNLTFTTFSSTGN